MKRTGRPPSARASRPFSVSTRFVTAGVGAQSQAPPGPGQRRRPLGIRRSARGGARRRSGLRRAVGAQPASLPRTVTVLVLLHLSNKVRHRPEHVEALRGTKHFMLFSSWVDRARENFLL